MAAAEMSPSGEGDDGDGGTGAFATGAAAGSAGTMAAGSAAVAGLAGAGGQAGIPLASTPLAFATAVCSKIWECCNDVERAMLVAGTTEEDCSDAFQASLTLDVAEFTIAEAAGRAVYDGVMFEACLRDYGMKTCTTLRESEKIQCFDAVRPKVAEGFSCGAHFECVDSYCDGGSGAATPDGRCAARKADGYACSDPEECDSGYCDVIAGCSPAPASVGLCRG